MSKKEFLIQLINLLDSAPFNWALYEDDLGTVLVTDLMDLISLYNQGREE